MPQTVDLAELGRILERLPSDPRIVISGNAATPQSIIDLIDTSVPRVTLHLLNAIADMPARPGVTLETAFVGPGMRRKPNLRYIPCRLSMVPLLLQRDLRPDVVIVHTSTPRDQVVSLGIEVNILPAAIESARANGALVVAAVNPQMPFTLGDSQVRLTDVDYLVEVDDPLVTTAGGSDDPIAAQIGELISTHVEHGATLQLGIGAVPDAVLAALVDSRELRIWSEVIGDGVLELENAGVLDRDQPVGTSFILGSADLYQWADCNHRVRMVRTEVCNDPSVIAKNPAMTSVNGALEVDLHGQANASRVNGQIYSGIGGSTDFIIGAMHSPGGQSFMAMPSWHPKANKSTVVPALVGPVTSFQQTAVVTEQGIAWLFGASEQEQAQRLIDHAAHPQAREDLREAAAAMMLP